MAEEITSTSPEWQNYVLSQFSPDELYQGKHPNVNGLRRVVELVIGPIISGRVNTKDVTYHDSYGGGFRVTAEYEITIMSKTGEVVFSSVADAGPDNTDKIYRRYPAAMAETRAEARALRKALKIQVAASEELSKVAEEDDEPASSVQVSTIKSILYKLKINQEKFEEEHGPLAYLKKREAHAIIQQLNSMQQSKSKSVKEKE
jgi:hypothetical protein